MRVIVASVLAVLLISGTVAAQSPQTSAPPAPSEAPVASPAATGGPIGNGLPLDVSVRNAKACKAGTTCSWYLTIIDPAAATAVVTPFVQGATKNLLDPTTPLPTALTPGSYLVEASAWTAGVPTNGSKVPTGRTTSCATVLTVPTDPTVTGLDLKVQFKKKQKGCEITGVSLPAQLPPDQRAPAPSPVVNPVPSVVP